MHFVGLDPLIQSSIKQTMCRGDDSSWSDQTACADVPLCHCSDIDPPNRGPRPLVRPNRNAFTDIRNPGVNVVSSIGGLCQCGIGVEACRTCANYGEEKKSQAQRSDQ